MDSWTPVLGIGGGPPEKVFKIFCAYAYASQQPPSEQPYHGRKNDLAQGPKTFSKPKVDLSNMRREMIRY